MTWILVNDDGKESDSFDSRDDAVDEKQSLEQIGASLELQEVDDASESEDEPEGDDIEAEVIEMSNDGGNSTDTDDDEDLEIIGDGGRPYVYCDNCNRLSTCAYRCPDSECGADLAGKPFYRGGDDE